MTRGKIIYITKNMQVYSTIEFNGDMYPFEGGHGEEIIEYFLKQGFRDIYSYQTYVKRMDERYLTDEAQTCNTTVAELVSKFETAKRKWYLDGFEW